MFPLKASELTEIVRGQALSGEETLLESVNTDTRSLEPGDLYIPLKGSKYDGHDFISAALERGAKGFLIEQRKKKIVEELKELLSQKIAVIIVDSCLKALQAMAKHARSTLAANVIGITGSTGKTSTKDMVASILSQSKQVVYSEESYNNEIGVPLTILGAGRETEVIVVEMAMRGLGQITELTKIAMPTLGLVTNVGKTHFELLGSEERIGEAKSELVRAIPANGAVILNADDLWTQRLRKMAVCPVFTYGLSPDADVRALSIRMEKGQPSFALRASAGDISVNLPTLGRHSIYNALAASAVALQLGEKLENIKLGLEHCRISRMRMECFTTADGITILNDAYNANPTSMEAALRTLQDVAGESRKIAVLGDMLELGPIAKESHHQIGKIAYGLGVDILIVVGELSVYIAEGAASMGMKPDNILICQSLDEAASLLNPRLEAGDVVLVKASRAIKMEEIVNSIVKS